MKNDIITEIEKVSKLAKINRELLNTLIIALNEVIQYAKVYNIPLPPNIIEILDKVENMLTEINYKIITSVLCPICGKLNPENAKYCAYCGSSLIITRIRHLDDNTRKGDRTKFIIAIFLKIIMELT